METETVTIKNNRLFFVNIGQGPHRCWPDCSDYDFISAGQHPKWSKPLCKLEPGDIIVSYLKKHGYVGIGRVIEKAVPVLEFMYNNRPLKEQKLKIPNIYEHSGTVNSEYLMKVAWLKAVGSHQAKWRPKSGLYTPQRIQASLLNQPVTVKFIEEEFNVKFEPLDLIR